MDRPDYSGAGLEWGRSGVSNDAWVAAGAGGHVAMTRLITDQLVVVSQFQTDTLTSSRSALRLTPLWSGSHHKNPQLGSSEATSMDDQQEAVLVVEQGLADLSVIDLESDPLVLGRIGDADVLLDNPYVSRRHAKIVRDEKGYAVEDLGSKNGTFVNGTRLAETERRLKTGDRIELGPGQVVLRFESRSVTITMPAYAPAKVHVLEVDPLSREVRLGSTKIDPPLSRKEFDVLSYLYGRRGEACSKDEIASRGWPDRETGDVSDQEIEQCIRRLRLRIETNPSQPQHVLTVRGFGYKLAQE